MSTPQNQINVKLQVVKEIETETGGLVIVYLATPESIMKEFYLASFDDKFMEVSWGIGDTIEEALKNAEREWNELKDELEEDNGNPFTEALQKLNSVSKVR
jgi:predicted RNase H-like HicB family nuclease